jgi:hypothetical protein
MLARFKDLILLHLDFNFRPMLGNKKGHLRRSIYVLICSVGPSYLYFVINARICILWAYNVRNLRWVFSVMLNTIFGRVLKQPAFDLENKNFAYHGSTPFILAFKLVHIRNISIF